MRVRARRFVEILTAVLALGVPLFLSAQYLHADHSAQRNDNSFHLLETQNSYLHIRNDGLLRGVPEAFFDRAFRPILMPHLATPIFFLTGGNARLTVALFILGCYALFLTYTFLILRKYLKGADLVLATLILGLSPTVVHFTQDFNSELPMIALFVPFLYYLKKSDFFSSERDSAFAGLFLGLSICIRPIETGMVATIIGVPYLLITRSKKLLKNRDLLIYCLIIAVTAGCLLYQLHVENNRPHSAKARYLLLAFLPLVPILLRKSLKLTGNIWWFFGLAFFFPVFWFAPVAEALWGWVSQASFSTFTQNTGSRSGVSVWQFLARAAQFGFWPLWALTLGVAILWIRKIRKSSIRELYPVLIVLPAILIPPLIGSLTFNGDPKEYLLGDLMLCLVSTILALAPLTKLRYFRTAVFALVAALLIQYRIAVIHSNQDHGDPVSDFWSAHVDGPALQAPLAHDVLEENYNEFAGHLPHSPAEPRLRICILQMRQNNDLDWVTDDFALTVHAQELGEHWLFDDPFPLVAPTAQGKYEWVKANCNHIIVLPIEHIPNAPIDFFMSDVGELVLDSWKRKKLSQDGLTLEAQGKFKDNHGHTGEYLMLKPIRDKHET